MRNLGENIRAVIAEHIRFDQENTENVSRGHLHDDPLFAVAG
jgi:hypothetical protein